MKENKNFLLVGILIAVMLIGIVSAEITTTDNGIVTQINTQPDNFIGRIISYIQFNIFQQGTFTVYGDTLGCSKNPDNIKQFKSGIVASAAGTNPAKFTSESGSAFVNWFRGSPNDGTYSNHLSDSRQFISEVFIKQGQSTSFNCDSGAYWNGDCYGEIYYCPNPCYSNSDCSVGSTCDTSILSQKIPSAGVCKTAEQQQQLATQITKVYRCDNGIKTFLGDVSSGDKNFCTNPLNSKYLIGSTDQCLSYEPSICNTPISNSTSIIPLKSAPLTSDEFNQATPKIIVASMCLTGSDCLARENYSVSCIFSNDIKNINKNAVSAVSKSEGGLSAVCWGLSDSLIGIPSKIIFGSDFGCGNYQGKDPTISGTCRASETGGVCSFLSQLSFFKITGDKCSDGGITLVGGIVLIFFLLSMVGGKK